MHVLGSLLIWNGVFLALGVIGAVLWRHSVSIRWFAASLLLFNFNVALVLDMFGIGALVSNMLGLDGLAYNWVGKALALAASLGIVIAGFVPAKPIGFTFEQSQHARWGWGLVVFMFALSIVVGWLVPDEPQTMETIAYQMTMPSLEEELFYRGILLYCLVRAFGDGSPFLNANFGYAALVSTVVFTIIHGVFWSMDGLVLSADALLFAGIFGILLMWLRLNTGNLLAAILLHSIINTVWRLV